MSDKKKVVQMPGVLSTDEPVLTEEHFKVEEDLVQELDELIQKYNGRLSNLAMVGALGLYMNMVSLGCLEVDDE
tara:strand:- start:2076 stop:2297 length:222 start_codon:yes stop_codon:yes gene_type:complete